MKLFFVFAVVACLLAMCCQGQVETRLSPQQQSQIEELNAALVATRLERRAAIRRVRKTIMEKFDRIWDLRMAEIKEQRRQASKRVRVRLAFKLQKLRDEYADRINDIKANISALRAKFARTVQADDIPVATGPVSRP